MRRRGFTLIELVVAGMVVAGITAAVTVSISQVLRAKVSSQARQGALLRAESAVALIGRDVQNAVRAGDLYLARVLITDEDRNGAARDELLVFTGSMALARPTSDDPEGGTYEVQYRLVDEIVRGNDARRDDPGRTVLWRRVDPIPDDVPAGGGVAFPVAQGLISLSVDAFDGERWLAEWDSDSQGYPHAVRVQASAVSEDGRRVETARRVVSLDRVPRPFDKPRRESGEDDE